MGARSCGMSICQTTWWVWRDGVASALALPLIAPVRTVTPCPRPLLRVPS